MRKYSGLLKMIAVVLTISALIFLTIFCNRQIEGNPYLGPSKTAQMASSPLLYIQSGSLYYKLKGMPAIKITEGFDSEVFIAPGHSRLAYYKNESRTIGNSLYKESLKVRSLYFYDINCMKETKVSDNCVIEAGMRNGVEFGYKGFLFYTAFDPDDRNINIYIFNGTVSMPLIRKAYDFKLNGNYKKMFYTSYEPDENPDNDPVRSISLYEILTRKNRLIDEGIDTVSGGDEIDFAYFLYDKKTEEGVGVYLWENGIRKAVSYDSTYGREYFDYRSYFYSVRESGSKTYEYHLVEKNNDTVIAKGVMDHTFDTATGNVLYVTESGYYYKPLKKAPVLLAKSGMSEPVTNDWKTFYSVDFSAKGQKNQGDLYSFLISGNEIKDKKLVDTDVAEVRTFDGMNGAVYHKNDGTGDRGLFLITNNADGTFYKKTHLGAFAQTYQVQYMNDRLYILLSEKEQNNPGDLLVYYNGGVKTLLESAGDMIVRNDMVYVTGKDGTGPGIYEIDTEATKIAGNAQIFSGSSIT